MLMGHGRRSLALCRAAGLPGRVAEARLLLDSICKGVPLEPETTMLVGEKPAEDSF